MFNIKQSENSHGASIIIIGIILAIILIGTFCTYQNFVNQPRLIGGDKDAGGCLVGAGYSWCAPKNKCLRVWEEKCEMPTSTSTATTSINTSGVKSCAQKGGVWYPGENLCEVNQLSESQCKTAGGVFNECASACRHDPKAQVCTMQCVLTCTFK